MAEADSQAAETDPGQAALDRIRAANVKAADTPAVTQPVQQQAVPQQDDPGQAALDRIRAAQPSGVQEPEETWGQTISRDWRGMAKAAGHGAVLGTAGALGLPGLVQRGTNWLTGGLLYNNPISGDATNWLLPTPGDYLKGAQNRGVYDPDYQYGSYPEAVAGGIGQAVPSWFTGRAGGMTPIESGAYSAIPAVLVLWQSMQMYRQLFRGRWER
jgi:hypothetical protein